MISWPCFVRLPHNRIVVSVSFQEITLQTFLLTSSEGGSFLTRINCPKLLSGVIFTSLFLYFYAELIKDFNTDMTSKPVDMLHKLNIYTSAKSSPPHKKDLVQRKKRGRRGFTKIPNKTDLRESFFQ